MLNLKQWLYGFVLSVGIAQVPKTCYNDNVDTKTAEVVIMSEFAPRGGGKNLSQ